METERGISTSKTGERENMELAAGKKGLGCQLSALQPRPDPGLAKSGEVPHWLIAGRHGCEA